MKELSYIMAGLVILFLATSTKDGVEANNSTEPKVAQNPSQSEQSIVNGDEDKERKIDTNSLPNLVRDNIATQYPGAELLEADEITRKDGRITYDVEIRINGKVIELMYDAQGKFLGVVQKDSFGEGDDEKDDGETSEPED